MTWRRVGPTAFAILVLLTGAPSGIPAQQATAVSQSATVCAGTISDVAADTAATQSALEALARDLATQPPKPTPPGTADPNTVIAQAREELKWAVTITKQAEAQVKAAEQAPNPAVARVLLKDAQLKADNARSLVRRVANGLAMSDRDLSTVPTARAVALEPREGLALFQLKRAAGLGGKSYGRAAFYESADAVSYDSATEALVVPGGRSINVKTLTGVLRAAGARGPVFEPVPAPGTGRPAIRLSPSAQQVLGSPQTRQRAEQVGGVELQVTLDLLGYLGVPDFRTPGPASVIENPVLVSLARLHARLGPYARAAAAWERLPDDLRYPGGVERVHGFVLDAKNGDVVLVGSRARTPATRMDIDVLVTVLKTVWLEGLTPAVSLDPLPDQPGGPQYSRVIAVPADSTVARIMLDADYAMKRIMMGIARVAVPAYRSYATIVVADPRPSRDRFWLSPMPLGARDVHISTTGRSILFETGVRVLTEGQRVVAGGLGGTGTTSPSAVKAAESFTEAYAGFEGADFEPRGVFIRLHGLIDMVTAAKIWREMGVDVPALQSFVRLPVRRLQGADAVPTYYSGLSVETLPGSYLSGGVQARARATRRSLDRYQDVTTATLEHAVDTFPARGGYARPVALRLRLPRSGADVSVQAERLFVAGQTALGENRVTEARARLVEATAADPFHAEAWAYRAQAEALGGDHRAARASIQKASELEPMDTGIQTIALDVELRANPRTDLSTRDERIRRLLSEDYALRAIATLSEGRGTEARRNADTALRLWDETAEAYVARAWTWPTPLDQGATRDWVEAIRGFRRKMRTDPEQARAPLALALAMRAFVRTVNLDLTQATNQLTTSALLDELQRAVDEAREARQLDPSNPLAICAEAMARAFRVALGGMIGQKANIDVARQLADDAVRRFADFSQAHFTRAAVLRIEGRLDEAVRSLGDVIRLDPTSGDAFAERADIHAEAGRCGDARADVDRARRLGFNVDKTVLDAIRRCPQR